MPRFCPACGVQVIEGGTFCPKCGTRVPTTPGTEPIASAAPAKAPTVEAAQRVPSQPASVAIQRKGRLGDTWAGLLAYLFLPAIVFLFLEPYRRNQFLRFHSIQSLVLTGSFLVLALILLSSIIGVFFLVPIATFWFIVVVICMIKAFQSQIFRLPILGEFAAKHAGVTAIE